MRGRSAKRQGDQGSSAPWSAPRGVDQRLFVVALARGLEILRAFQPGDGVLGNLELAVRTGLPKATVSRLTYTLTQLGHLVHVKKLNKYRLGTNVLALGYALMSDLEIRRVARPYMEQLAEYGRANVGLAIPDRLEMLYLDACRGSGNITHRLDTGSKVPMESTALGQAFLAGISEPERAFLLDKIRARRRDDWTAVRRTIERAIRDVQDRGFCVAQWQPDITAAGVPLVAPDGSGVYALNCGGPNFLLSRERIESDLGPRLVSLVQNVARGLPRSGG